MRTGMAASSNIFVPSAHSVGDSPSQVPGQTCVNVSWSTLQHAATLMAIFYMI